MKIKLYLFVVIGITLLISGWTQQSATFVYAQTKLQSTTPTDQEVWPPFWFDLTPVYESGKIVYTVTLSRQVDWPMSDLTIKIPLPEGSRFVEAKTPLDVQSQFDGREITFLAPAFDRYFDGNSFIVEVADPARTIFTTQARISWGGGRSGTYETETISFDTTREPLNWTAPPASSVQLGVGAVVANNTITYMLYPKAIGRERKWDMNINLPLPEGSTFLSIDAPPIFTTRFDGQESSFKAIELEHQSEPAPLTFSVSTTGITSPAVATYLWADWKNAVSSKEPGIPAEEQIMIDLVVRQPDLPQQVVFDQAGDVPFANYDLTSIAFQNRGPILAIIFNTAGPIGSVGQSLQYTLFIDSDCNSSTGESIRNRGAEFQVRYDHESGQAVFMAWDAEAKDWDWLHPTELTSLVDDDQITVSTPLNLIGVNRRFCWAGRASNGTANFNPDPPLDWLPNDAYQALTQYEIGERIATGITGKLAIPLTNAQDFYDVHIFVLPDGQDITTIPNARQPNFRFDGQRLLLNHEGGGEKQVEYNSNNGGSAVLVLKNYNTPEDIYEYNLTTAAETQISSFSGAAYPFYNAPGNQFVFASTPLSSPSMAAPDSSRLYVQCGLQPPEYEEMLLCQNLSEFGMLVSAGKNEIQGSYPLWTSDHKIIYQGCTNSSEPATCGIYTIDSSATPRGGNHASPLQLTQNVNDIPSDTKGNLIAFTAYRDDNWEAYLMNLDGTNVRNLSNNSKANDGLPAISPDSKSVAFVSDRGGQWAVWMASVDNGSIQKLFDLPVQSPWGQGDRVWTNERISWGP